MNDLNRLLDKIDGLEYQVETMHVKINDLDWLTDKLLDRSATLERIIEGAKRCSRNFSVEYGWNEELNVYGYYAKHRFTDWCEWAGPTIEYAWKMIGGIEGDDPCTKATATTPSGTQIPTEPGPPSDAADGTG